MNEHSTVTLRTATALDAEALTGFLGELGIVMPEGSDAMTAHWRNLWVDNPAMVYHDKGIACTSDCLFRTDRRYGDWRR